MSLNFFKVYDVRANGLDEVNEDLVRSIANAPQRRWDPALRYSDMTYVSATAAKDAWTAAICGPGRDNTHIGQCGAEEISFQTAHVGTAGGIMVTASHNPMDYNGLQMVRAGGRPISGDAKLFMVRNDVVNGPCFVAPHTGKVVRIYLNAAHIQQPLIT